MIVNTKYRGCLYKLKKRKHLNKRKKQQPTENQKSTKYQSGPKCQLKGAQFLHLACQGRRLALLPPVSYAMVTTIPEISNIKIFIQVVVFFLAWTYKRAVIVPSCRFIW